VTTVWLSGTGRYPTIRVPKFLAPQYRLDDSWISDCKQEGRPAQIELISISTSDGDGHGEEEKKALMEAKRLVNRSSLLPDDARLAAAGETFIHMLTWPETRPRLLNGVFRNLET
jgi:hypothetical protein